RRSAQPRRRLSAGLSWHRRTGTVPATQGGNRPVLSPSGTVTLQGGRNEPNGLPAFTGAPARRLAPAFAGGRGFSFQSPFFLEHRLDLADQAGGIEPQLHLAPKLGPQRPPQHARAEAPAFGPRHRRA